MWTVEVKSTEVRTKTGVSARTGKPYTIREQSAYISIFDREGKPAPYPVEMIISLGDDQAPYPVGTYQIGPASIWINRYKQLEISPVLVPVAKSLAKVA